MFLKDFGFFWEPVLRHRCTLLFLRTSMKHGRKFNDGHNAISFRMYQDWETFIRSQWSQHTISSRTPLSFDDIKYIKSVIAGYVVQGRDHAPNHLHIFCPLFYWKILKSIFGDEEVYTRSLLTPHQAQVFLATLTKKPWLKPYQWGVQETAKLPCSYLLLKQKKQFLKARPIISYKSFVFGRLFQAASITSGFSQQLRPPVPS